MWLWFFLVKFTLFFFFINITKLPFSYTIQARQENYFNGFQICYQKVYFFIFCLLSSSLHLITVFVHVCIVGCGIWIMSAYCMKHTCLILVFRQSISFDVQNYDAFTSEPYQSAYTEFWCHTKLVCLSFALIMNVVWINSQYVKWYHHKCK